MVLKRKTIEDYVELVYDLQKRGKRVHTNDIASALNIKPASVTEIFQKLDSEGYINYEKYSGVTLTSRGRNLAIRTKRKHQALKEFLILLGVDKQVAEKDACEMEHILDPTTMDIIIKFVEMINRCEITPFWLERFKRFVESGRLEECPPELVMLCQKVQKTKKNEKNSIFSKYCPRTYC